MLSSPRALVVSASLALVSASAACASRHAPPPAPPNEARASAAPQGPAVPPGHLARAEVDRVLVTQGPPWILRRVLSEEVLRSDGKFIGWRMVGLPEDWRDIDLRPGDIVTRVNGLPLETPDQAFEAWRSVASATAVTLTLMRDGAARQLIIPIDGPVSQETLNALGKEPGPRQAVTPESRGRTLGGGALDADQEPF
jgi:hypothetical protein